MSEIISSGPNLEREIEVLERRLAEKRAELTEKGSSSSDREILGTVIKERMVEKMPPVVSKSSVAQPVVNKKITPIIPHGKVSVQKIKNLPKEQQLEILVGIALSESIPEAVLFVEKLDSPYLLDELHDVLIDKFYETLIKQKKI